MMRKAFLLALLLLPITINYEPSMDIFSAPSSTLVFKAMKSKPSFLEREIQCMADNIYYEATGEPIEGKVAVAQVVINRTHYKFYPHTVCGVVYDPAQFSWTRHKPARKNYRAYKEDIRIARAVLTKHLRSSIIGANVIYYHNNMIDTPNWAVGQEPVAVIGNHLFYARVSKI